MSTAEFIIHKWIREGWKHVAYEPKSNKILLFRALYRCRNSKEDFYMYLDGDTGIKKIKASETKHWVYLGLK